MKVVIADDEENVRRGIELAVRWERFGITERFMAEDGHQAIELIRQHKPAILFCDMSMPRMDGVALLRSLREEGWNTQVIVVSGYDDYSYTRATLLANGVDYILKPFKTKDLEEAVSRAVTACLEQGNKSKAEHEHRHRLTVADSLMDEQKLIGYLKGEMAFNEQALHRLFHKIGLPLQGLRVACMLPKNKNRLIDRKYAGDIGLFHFAANNITQDIWKSVGAHYLCRMDDYQWLIIAASSQPEKFENEYDWRLEKLCRAWHETLGLEVIHGTAAGSTEYTVLPQAIAEAKAFLLKHELLQDRAPGGIGELPRFADREVPLLNAIQKGNKLAIADIIESFVDSLKSRGSLRLEQLQMFTLEANLMLKRASSLCQTNMERVDWLLPMWICDLIDWQMELSHRCWEMADACGSDESALPGTESVRRYIEQYYQENISLSTLSERFHFSPRYLAKKFKEQFGKTIITYLTDLRIGKAKAMLEHSDLSIAEVGHSIGYEDENYFGKVFKKQTGVSPLQYRKQFNGS